MGACDAFLVEKFDLREQYVCVRCSGDQIAYWWMLWALGVVLYLPLLHLSLKTVILLIAFTLPCFCLLLLSLLSCGLDGVGEVGWAVVPS